MNRRPSLRIARAAVALTVMTIVAACGSTVQTVGPDGASAYNSADGAVLGTPTPGGADSLAGLEPGPGPDAGGGGSASAPVGGTNQPGPPTALSPGPGVSSTDTPSIDGPQPSPAPSSGIGPTGPGVTDTTISIGALTSNGAGKFQASLGFSGATGDQIALNKSVVNWINDNGGIAGRQIELVNYDLPTAEVANDPATAFQAACSHFTEDNKVFAVASILSDIPTNFYDCLRNAGVVIATSNAIVSSRFYNNYAGILYGPQTPNYTRILATSVDALWADGWLTKDSKVGVIGYDTSDAKATVDDGLIPALARHGLKLAAGVYTATGTEAANAYTGAVLKFRTAGVDRMFFAPGGQPIYMALVGGSQGYRPLMSMSTLQFPAAVAANLSSSQLKGSAGIGWSPDLDLQNADAAKVSTPGRAACLDAIRGANQDLNSGTTMAIATWVCDDWFFIRDALSKVSAPHRSGFQSAAAQLGRSFRSATTFQTYFAPNRPSDGAAAYRLHRYNESCRCFRYTTALKQLP